MMWVFVRIPTTIILLYVGIIYSGKFFSTAEVLGNKYCHYNKGPLYLINVRDLLNAIFLHHCGS